MQMDKPLTSEELDIIQRLYKGENVDSSYDPYEPMVEWFTGASMLPKLPSVPTFSAIDLRFSMLGSVSPWDRSSRGKVDRKPLVFHVRSSHAKTPLGLST
jgi:hypothetical protein